MDTLHERHERGYKNISVKTELAEAVEDFIKINPHYGYRSITQFMEDAARKRLENLKALDVQLPRFEMINQDVNGVKVLDRKIHRVAEIYFKPQGVFCVICGQDKCEHLEFALSQPKVQNIIAKRRKEGWKLPET